MTTLKRVNNVKIMMGTHRTYPYHHHCSEVHPQVVPEIFQTKSLREISLKMIKMAARLRENKG